MENILHDFNEKVISLGENFLKNLIFKDGVASFTEDLVKEFAEFGSKITQYLIEYAEEKIFELEERKEEFESLEKDSRSIISIFGKIDYTRRYYKNKLTKEKIYLLDKFIGIMPKQRLLENVTERLLTEAIDSSYEKAGEVAAYGVKISKQEVKNEIEKLDLNKDFHDKVEEKKKVETLYIIADEGHVHLQKGGIEEPRIIVVYENIKKIENIRCGNQIAPAIALGMAIGRIGCFFTGCCYGIKTDLPIGIDFGDGINRIPTQLIEMAFCFILFVYLYYKQIKRKDLIPGILFKEFILYYFIFRFIIEFIRETTKNILFLSVYQIICLIGIIYTIIQIKRSKKNEVI